MPFPDVPPFVDTRRYPIYKSQSTALEDISCTVQAQIAQGGCAVLPGFVSPEHLPQVAAEVASLASKAYFSKAEATVYGRDPDESFPAGHPQRRVLVRHNGFVHGDLIGRETCLRALYHNKAVKRFLAQCLGLPELHEFADPLAQLVINVVKPNDNHAWHFDSNDFVVTLMTQAAETGGEFQYVPDLRRPGHENYDGVRAILEGSEAGVYSLDLRPGDLQLFFGRYSLHRVQPTTGARDRLTAVFSYSRSSDFIGTAGKTAKIYGRKLAVHDTHERDRRHPDQLVD